VTFAPIEETLDRALAVTLANFTWSGPGAPCVGGRPPKGGKMNMSGACTM
jgi:hypothetical protein